MKGRYSAAFILPVNTHKKLGDEGWEFEILERLPNEITESLVKVLDLTFLESYLGIDVYGNSELKMSIELDEKSLVRFISFQVYSDVMEKFKAKVKICSLYERIDCFIPSEGE